MLIREEITVQTRLFQGYYQILTFLPCHHLLNFLESAPFVECAQYVQGMENQDVRGNQVRWQAV